MELRAGERLARFTREAIDRTLLPRRALTLAYAASPGWTVAWLVCLIAQGLLPVAVVYLTRALVDGLVAAERARTGWAGLLALWQAALLMASALILTELLRAAVRWIRTAQAEYLRDHVSELVHEKASVLDLAVFESPDFQDRLDRARSESHTRPLLLLENAGTVLQSGLTLVAMMGVLAPYAVWLPLALLASTLPAFYVVLDHSVRQHRWHLSATRRKRRARYYDALLTSREPAAEIRLFDLSRRFRERYREQRQRLRTGQIALVRAQARAEALAGVSALAAAGAVLAWIGARAVQGLVTLGDVALFYQTFSQGQALMRALLGGVGQIYVNTLFLGDLFDFLRLTPSIVDPRAVATLPAALQRGIEFHNVRFTYPGSREPALHDLDLRVPAGQIVAIVGSNGAGKSTLIKLLCRFYDPDAGAITLDGIDLRTQPLHEVRRLITVLFQEPGRYTETVAENITLGDIASTPNHDALAAAARAAGADGPIARLPHGYETLLGRWFGGAELSVGEWQRIALARAFLRRAAILILDEPTSAMDAWAEADWLDRFRTLAAGRTAIIITHRFTTAMRADCIHVMDDGRIIESGSHADLVRAGGRYGESWARQTEHAQATEDPSTGSG